jgi:glutamate dehydrogenase/leucine dehydrogenase
MRDDGVSWEHARSVARGTGTVALMHRLRGRVIAITGAGSGIGRATALLVAEQGGRVAAIDTDEAGLQVTVDAV